MISVQKTNVPEYLRASSLFATAFQESDDDVPAEIEVDIPVDCFKLTPGIKNERDLHSLLRTVRFWLIPEYIENSAEFFSFVVRNRLGLKRAVVEFGEDFPFLVTLNKALIPTTKYSTIGSAAKFGLVSFIRYLRDVGHSWDCGSGLHFISIAAAKGQVKCMQYALENGCELLGDECMLAATMGHVDCLKCAHNHGCEMNQSTYAAALRSGSLACIKYLLESIPLNLRADANSMDLAATCGHLHVLRYLHNEGFPAAVSTASLAASHDHLDCLQYLHEIGCAWDVSTAAVCAYCGNIECLVFLHENGCPWDATVVQPWSIQGHVEVDIRARRTACAIYAVDHGCPIVPAAYSLALILGSVALLRSVRSRGVAWGASVADEAAERGNVECLQFLLDNGCPCNISAYFMAMRSSQLRSVEFLHEHGVAWNATVTANAVAINEHEVLYYLLKQGCPYGADLLRKACKWGHITCMQHLHQQGIPWTEDVVSAAIKGGMRCSFEYALDQGCPYSAPACNLAASTAVHKCIESLLRKKVQLTGASVLSEISQQKLACIEVALQRGCISLGPVCCAAAACIRDSSEHLQHLRLQGMEWDVSTAQAAIRNKAFACLEYAVLNHCPVDGSLCAMAAERGSLSMLAWLHKRRCPWDGGTTAAAVRCDRVSCLRYALENGCPYEVPAAALDKSPRCREYMPARHSVSTEVVLVVQQEVQQAVQQGVLGEKRKAPEPEEHNAENVAPNR